MIDDSTDVHQALRTGSLSVIGQLRTASNATLLCEVSGANGPVRAVYKPLAGERPLWDFPEGTLGRREVLAHTLSTALGWNLVPTTVWRDDGPYGPGMCQLWIDEVEESPVRVMPVTASHGLVVIEGEDPDGNPVVLVHDDTVALQRMAIFDALANNADRKGGHVLLDEAGRIWGIDHGVTFSHEPKLRTVLWGWAGQAMPEELLGEVIESVPALHQWAAAAAEWLEPDEMTAWSSRLDALLETATFPEPTGDWPFLPWPPI